MTTPDSPSGGVRLAVDGPLATVTLDRPERRNAMTPETWSALARIGRDLRGDVRVVLLRAEGPSFSAGLDRSMMTDGALLELGGLPDAEADAAIEGFQQAFTWWRRNDIISIAAVGGHAVGAGFQLALACDVRIVADDVQFSMKEPALGLVPDLGGTKPLVDLVGPSRALEICGTTRWVGAEEALRIGLANHVVPRAELDERARELAAGFLAIGRDPLIETKALLYGARTRDHEAQRAAERAAQIRRIRDLRASTLLG